MQSSESVSRADLKRVFLKWFAVLRLKLVLGPDLEELRDRPWGSGEKACRAGRWFCSCVANIRTQGDA